MDGTRFDRVARALAQGADRRTVVRGLGAAVGLGVVALGGGGAAAKAPQSRCKEYCRGQGLSGQDFGRCVSACARAGGPPPEETCLVENQECTPPEGNEEDPCCAGLACSFDPRGEGEGLSYCVTPI